MIQLSGDDDLADFAAPLSDGQHLRIPEIAVHVRVLAEALRPVQLHGRPAMGLDVEYYNYKDCSSGPAAVASEKGQELNQKVIEWCASHDAQEIESVMEAARVPCATVNTAKSAYENEHFRSRGDWVKYQDQTTGAEIEAFGIAPKMSETPGQIWRGAPSMGQDTENILKTILGYDDAKIAELKEKNLI